MQVRTSQVLSKEEPSAEHIVGEMYRRGIRFPTGKLHGVMMRFFDKEDLPTALFVLKHFGMKEVRAPEPDMRKFTNGENEVCLYTRVPDYYLDKIGMMAI